MEEKKPTLEAKLRDKKEKNSLKNLIPAVVYGKDFENLVVWVDYKSFNRLYREIGESTIIDLAVEGRKQPERVLIYEMQRDPISGNVTHLDFYKVRMDEEIEKEVSLEFVGVAPAVKESGGTFVQNMDEVEVKCLPGDLPASISVDISILKTFDDYIYAKDLKVGEKVEIMLDPETVIALVSAPRTEKELEDLEGEIDADVSKVEGIQKEEKKDEAGEATSSENKK